MLTKVFFISWIFFFLFFHYYYENLSLLEHFSVLPDVNDDDKMPQNCDCIVSLPFTTPRMYLRDITTFDISTLLRDSISLFFAFFQTLFVWLCVLCVVCGVLASIIRSFLLNRNKNLIWKCVYYQYVINSLSDVVKLIKNLISTG